MYSILHCEFVYLCIYDLFHIPLSLRHTYGFKECIYVCVGYVWCLYKTVQFPQKLLMLRYHI